MAMVSLVLASVMLLLGASLVLLAAAHRADFQGIFGDLSTSKPDEMMQSYADYLKSHGGRPPGWLMALVGLFVMMGICWVATVICGILGVRWAKRRGVAVAALVVAGLTSFVFCCGGAFSPG